MEKKVITHRFPILGLLGLAFIVLKLCGVINWSWWWVLAPFWGLFALAIVVMAIVFCAGVIFKTAEYFVDK